MSSTIYAIEATRLTYHIGSFVLDSHDWTVSSGECVVLHGPNGAGKTTMLKLLAGIYRPKSGGIRIFGHDLWKDPLQAKNHLGYVSVLPQALRHLTGREFVTFIAGLYPKTWPQDIDSLVALLGLVLAWNDPISSYSYGMLQKLCLIAQLSHEPLLLLIDEPGYGFDEPSLLNLLDILERYRNSNHALVVASHDPRFIHHHGWRSVRLEHGKVLSG